MPSEKPPKNLIWTKISLDEWFAARVGSTLLIPPAVISDSYNILKLSGLDEHELLIKITTQTYLEIRTVPSTTPE